MKILGPPLLLDSSWRCSYNKFNRDYGVCKSYKDTDCRRKPTTMHAAFWNVYVYFGDPVGPTENDLGRAPTATPRDYP
jgi:hypothetical protein